MSQGCQERLGKRQLPHDTLVRHTALVQELLHLLLGIGPDRPVPIAAFSGRGKIGQTERFAPNQSSNHLRHLRDPSPGRNPEFGQVGSDRMQQHGALFYQESPGPVQHGGRLLLGRFHRHEAHCGAGDRLADCFRIRGVVLLPLSHTVSHRPGA